MKLIDKISALMMDPKKIRNIVLVAHIDHGKTTLSDSLLASAGILAPSIAGEARALDYLPEEQRRGITMKTANISLILNNGNEDYLINLIDSPGHVDFSGKVARALRIVDGAIVVIDAVEQIMAQTETVIRQCLYEGVKPVLFINKIDRLINELKLSPKQIVERIEIVYNNYNSLIEKYSRDKSIPKWKCTTKNGSVIFGSALHRWAISLPIIKEMKITFEKIIDFYSQNNLKGLQELLPIEKPLISLIIDHLPDPRTAQQYRIKNIWKGDLSSNVGLAMINCQANEENTPLVFGTTKMLMDQHAGLLVLGRIFSGIIKEKTPIKLVNTKEIEKIQNIYIFMGADKIKINNVPAGNTVALSGLSNINTGETIVDMRLDSFKPFEEIHDIANPVVTVALEPKMLRDLPLLKRVLEKFELEDPNLVIKIDDQTGEILLMGLGELHLDTIVKEISTEIACEVSEPLVVIVEMIEKSSEQINKELFGTKVELFIQQNVKEQNIAIYTFERKPSTDDLIVKLRQYNNEIIITKKVLQKFSNDTINNILAGIKNALTTGPLSGKPVSSVRVIISNFETLEGEKFEHTLPLLRNAVWDGLKACKIAIYEPIYKIQITSPITYLGKVTSIINKRRGNIVDVRTDQELLVISGALPVGESFNIDKDLRSETEGRAFWQMSFERYDKISKTILKK